MKVEKRVLCEERVRRVPEQFSWVDHRLVRDGLMRRCPASAWGLYLFLVTVGDAEGLSYYSDRSLCQALNLSEGDLAAARRRLMEEDLLDWETPLYQVLSVPERRTA
jgi:hypothetical protein